MSADRDSEAHSLAVGMRKIRESYLRLCRNGDEVSALTTIPEGFNRCSTRPPYPRAAMRKVSAARIDPTAVCKGIDVSRSLAFTARRYARGRHTAFNVT